MQDKKIFTSMAVTLALMAGMTSCSNYDELNSHNSDEIIPINLISSIDTRSINQDIQNTQISSGTNVGVFVTAGDNSSLYDNNMLTANGKGGFTGQEMSFPEDGGSVNIYAYAPHNGGWAQGLNSEYTFTVPTDQSSDNAYCNADLMVGIPSSNPVAPTTGNIMINFKHKLTKLNIDFDMGDTDVNLNGATVSVKNVKTSTTVNIKTGNVGQASGNVSVITAAKFAADATDFSASAIFVPQTIESGTELVEVKLEGVTYNAILNQKVTFECGKRYTYTVKFETSSAGETTVSLQTGSTVQDWEDGNSQELSAAVGDYVTNEGKIIKYAEAENHADKDKIVAVVFSTTVSDSDKSAGYNVYAMGLSPVNSKKWIQDATVITGSVLDFATALTDLDGRTKTAEVLANDIYTNYTEKSSTFFEYCSRDKNLKPVGEIGSDWFVPSIGQIIQILNNLGQAGINSSSTVYDKNTGSPVYYQNNTDSPALNNINGYITKVGKEAIYDTSKSSIYATVSEYMGNFWCLQTCPSVNVPNEGSKNFDWGFGKNATKVSGNFRSFVPCVAIKIPSNVQ